MCECARCKKTYEDQELTWVTVPDKRPKMEVVCKDCLEKEKRADQY